MAVPSDWEGADDMRDAGCLRWLFQAPVAAWERESGIPICPLSNNKTQPYLSLMLVVREQSGRHCGSLPNEEPAMPFAVGCSKGPYDFRTSLWWQWSPRNLV